MTGPCYVTLRKEVLILMEADTRGHSVKSDEEQIDADCRFKHHLFHPCQSEDCSLWDLITFVVAQMWRPTT